MAIREIRIQGDSVLEKKCKEVKEVTPRIRELIDDMLETMYAAEGIGLAAPQVSIPIQLVVIDIPKEEESVTWLKVNGEDKELSDIMPLMFANPVLEPYGPMHPFHEGCLSVMKIRASVVRPDFVKATVLLIDGREITIDCNGLLARCLQHECDHLNGILFVERVSSAQKITLRNKLKRLALGY